MATNHALTLIRRDGCHLCDDARAVIDQVLEQIADLPGERTLTEVSIDDDSSLREEYWEQIPVLLIDGKVHNFWRIDADRLAAALST